MSFLVPKLILTPLLITSASLAGRRWGPATTGWIVALPLTSGPIFVFIALELGFGPAISAANGALAGAIGQIAFAAAYAALARRAEWRVSVLGGAAAFGLIVSVVPTGSPALSYVLTLATAALLVRWLLSERAHTPAQPTAPSRWDIPARALVATALVVSISGVAPMIGGHAAGILATFPVYAAVLTTFAQRVTGPLEARAVLLGLTIGLPGFATFFLVAASEIVRVGLWPALGLALAAAVGLNVILLAGLRRVAGTRVTLVGPE